VLLLTPDALKADPDGYRAVAENLVRHGTFGNQQTPTAYRPPLYPCVLAPCVVFGPASRVAIGLLHLALGLGTVWLTCRLGQLCGLGRWAWLAAALVACDPILLAQSALVMTETLATFLAVASLVWLTRTVQNGREADAIIAGACVGLAILCRPTFLPWAAIVAFALPWGATTARSRVRIGLAFVVQTALVLLPWAARNQVQFGRPIVTTTHGGYTLLLANNPDFYEYLRSASWGTVWENKALDRAWAAKAPRGAQANEVRADRLAYGEAIQNIRNEPAMFCYACLVRVGRLFGVVPHQLAPDESVYRRWLRYAVGLWYVAELSLAALGVAVLFKTVRRRGDGSYGWVLIGSLVVCFAIVHAVYWTDMRMRSPLVSAIALLAAAALAWLQARMKDRKCLG
jgi:4-amino-4-deoxy-L-arabinose transferase-like glycosyltransferase